MSVSIVVVILSTELLTVWACAAITDPAIYSSNQTSIKEFNVHFSDDYQCPFIKAECFIIASQSVLPSNIRGAGPGAGLMVLY